MRGRITGICVVASALLASCGKPDNSGIYVAASERQATLVQLVQTPDGRLTGRVEEMSVQAQGQIKDDVSPLEGAASGHDLTLSSKPVSFLPGLSMTGRVAGGALTLAGQGVNVQAQRSSLAGYQAAVARLRILAQREQEQAAEARAAEQAARAAQEAKAAENQRQMAIANTEQSLGRAVNELREITVKFNAEVAKAPDFGLRADANTNRMNTLAGRAAGVAGLERGQLRLDAGQVLMDTGHIKMDRNQYGMGLGLIAQPGETLANRIDAFCANPAPSYVADCKSALVTSVDFKAAIVRGKARFQGFDQVIKAAQAAQSAAMQKMAGG
jgi:hypothetical protein